jgi:PiT family inorganic phosphate transporter
MLRLINVLLFTAKPSGQQGVALRAVLTAAGLAFSHGANDAQKSMGMLTLASAAPASFIPSFEVPFWVMLACAIGDHPRHPLRRLADRAHARLRHLPGAPDARPEFPADLGRRHPHGASVIGAPVSTTHVVSDVDHGHRCRRARRRPSAGRRPRISASPGSSRSPGSALVAIQTFAIVNLFLVKA